MDEYETHSEYEVKILNESEEPEDSFVRKLDLEEAREAADYHAIFRDAQYVIEVCEHLELRLMNEESRREGSKRTADIETYVDRSLWTAALVAYVRCYSPGVRVAPLDKEEVFAWTPQEDEEQPSEAQEHFADLHRYFKDIRDKHIAHSVNPMEDAEMCASLYRNDDGSLGVHDCVLVHTTSATLHHSRVQQLGDLALQVKGLAKRKCEDASRRAAKRARAMSQNELIKLRPYRFQPREDPQSVSSPRTSGKKKPT